MPSFYSTTFPLTLPLTSSRPFSRTRLAALLVSLALIAPSPALALTEWGAETIVSTANCPSFCTDFTFAPASGGVGSTSSFGEVSDTRGTGRALVNLDPAGGLTVPLLQGEAFSENENAGSALTTALGVEGYTYTGASSKAFDVDITLTGSVFDPTPNDLDTFIKAYVYVFTADGFFFTTSISTLLFESDAEVLAGETLEVRPNDADAADATRNATLSFTLSPGEQVYLYALMDVEAEREMSFADAFSTLTTEFQDSTGLVSASVPEPATGLLVGLGLAVMLGSRRRSAQQR